MDINRALRLAISTGSVTLGLEQARKAIEEQEAKLLIVASNAPSRIIETARKTETPAYRFHGNNVELGAACGKPFSISTVTILDEGSSEILALRPRPGPAQEPEAPELPASPPAPEAEAETLLEPGPETPVEDSPTEPAVGG